MTSSFMLVAARDDPIEVKLPLPPSTSDLRADAGKNHSKLQRSLSTVLALRRYFDLWERSDAHVRHDLLELRVPRAAAVNGMMMRK